MSARGFLGAGDLYISRQVGGSFLDYEGPFECTKFEIKPNVELKEQISKGRDTYGQVVETVALPKPAVLTVEGDDAVLVSLAVRAGLDGDDVAADLVIGGDDLGQGVLGVNQRVEDLVVVGG